MAPIKFSAIEDLTSIATTLSLPQHLPLDLINIKIFRIRAPLSNERIVLFSSSNRDLVDAQYGCNLAFFLK